MGNADLDNRFSFHAATPERALQHEHIRASCKEMAYYLDAVLPDGREKSLAITHLEDTMMWANAAIARSKA